MPNWRTRSLHKAARCMGLALGLLLAQPGIAIEPDAQPQQQEDRGPITCVVSNDGYDVHFTAYARVSPEDGIPGEAEPPVQFCQDLPATGPTHLTLDLMNREARTQPVALRVVREGDDDSEEASVPKESPPGGPFEDLLHRGRGGRRGAGRTRRVCRPGGLR